MAVTRTRRSGGGSPDSAAENRVACSVCGGILRPPGRKSTVNRGLFHKVAAASAGPHFSARHAPAHNCVNTGRLNGLLARRPPSPEAHEKKSIRGTAAGLLQRR